MEIHDLLLSQGADTSAFLLNLIGGIFARRDAKKRDKAAAEAAKVPVVTSHTVDLKRMVAESIDAGFNPKSILMAGGLSGYTTTSTTGQNAMAAVPTAPSMGSVIAGAAIKTVDDLASSGFFSGASPSFAQQAIPAISGGFTMGGALSRGGSMAMPSAKVVSNRANPYGFEQTKATQINSVPVILSKGGDPSLASADSVEQDYAELFSWPYAVGKAFADIVYNATGSSVQSRREALQAAPKTVPQTIGAGVGNALIQGSNALDYMRKWLQSSAEGYYVDPALPLSPAGGYDKINPLR